MKLARSLHRTATGLALVVMSVLFGAGVAAATPAAQTDAPAANGSDQIRVVQAPSGAGGFCLPAFLSLRNTVASDATTFRLRIEVTAPICDGVDAVAAVYAMPTDGSAWPQRLVETATVPLREPGVTEVIFTRSCRPEQFDVVTGATPQEIAPWGAFHGPLLFPFDTGTAHQSPGCGPAPVVPEVSAVVLLPLSAAVVIGGIAVRRGSRRRPRFVRRHSLV